MYAIPPNYHYDSDRLLLRESERDDDSERVAMLSPLWDVVSGPAWIADRQMQLRSPTELDAFNWAFLSLAIVLASLHLYLGLFAAPVPSDRATQFVIIGLFFLVGPVVYFTPYWQPLLYLLGAGFAVYLGGLWILSGMEYLLFGLVTGITATSFVLLGLYLFFREEFLSTGTEGR